MAERPRRVMLVPKAPEHGPGGLRMRRYGIARIAPSPRSALGEDRHERLERVAKVTRVEAAPRPAAAPDPGR